MLFEERNNPFVEVIQPPDTIGHAISVILSHYTATEEFLQRVKQLNITSVLNDREFGEHLDRKSTRLNSSHSQISYAVFCLKKKTSVSVATFHPAAVHL